MAETIRVNKEVLERMLAEARRAPAGVLRAAGDVATFLRRQAQKA